MGPLSIHEELVLMLSFRQVQDGYKVILASREGKLAPVVEGPRQVDFLSTPCPSKHGGPGLGGGFIIRFQVVLPGQEFLFLWSLDLFGVEDVGVFRAVHEDLGPVPILGAPGAVPPRRLVARLPLQRGALAARVFWFKLISLY